MLIIFILNQIEKAEEQIQVNYTFKTDKSKISAFVFQSFLICFQIKIINAFNKFQFKRMLHTFLKNKEKNSIQLPKNLRVSLSKMRNRHREFYAGINI